LQIANCKRQIAETVRAANILQAAGSLGVDRAII
jgi:hypothetical protein